MTGYRRLLGGMRRERGASGVLGCRWMRLRSCGRALDLSLVGAQSQVAGRWSFAEFQLRRDLQMTPLPNTDSYCGLRFSGLPIASRKMALLPFACGEKKLITSSSKKVSPVAPRLWAYAARYILPPMAPASSWTAR